MPPQQPHTSTEPTVKSLTLSTYASVSALFACSSRVSASRRTECEKGHAGPARARERVVSWSLMLCPLLICYIRKAREREREREREKFRNKYLVKNTVGALALEAQT